MENKVIERVRPEIIEKYSRSKRVRTPKLIKKDFTDSDITEMYQMFKKQQMPYTDNPLVTDSNKNLLMSLSSRLSLEEFIQVVQLNVWLSHRGNEDITIESYGQGDQELIDLIKSVQRSSYELPVDLKTQHVLESAYGDKPHLKLNKMFNTNFHQRRVKRGELHHNVMYNPGYYVDELIIEPARRSSNRNLLERIKIWTTEDDVEV